TRRRGAAPGRRRERRRHARDASLPHRRTRRRDAADPAYARGRRVGSRRGGRVRRTDPLGFGRSHGQPRPSGTAPRVIPLVAVVGATGTGKSELSLDLAERLIARGTAVEIVNADAMQLYRGMDIGTAKLALEQRRGIPHHLLDALEPSQE